MTRKILLLTLAATLGAGALVAQKGINNPMTRAVLDVYERELKNNPADYETWLNRANEYYRHDEYMRALNDVDNALRYIPTKETRLRCEALLLRANIYTQTGRPAQALNDLNMVIGLDPESYVAIYQRANTHYTLGNYADARTDFVRLQRLNSRSPEALVGLARIAVKENNLGQANEYLEQAVNQDPNNSDLYVRRATVRRDMGNHQGAVEDLMLALATDSRNARAINMLVDYGNINYPAVMVGLTDVIRQAPNVGMYPYLRATIAEHHGHYKAALSDFEYILERNLYNYQGIYRSMAECLFAMGRFDEALEKVDRALEMDHNAGDAAILRARILRAIGRYEEAKTQAAAATAILPNNAEALNELGLAYQSLGEYGQAADLFAETTLAADPSPMAQWSYLLRARVLDEFLNQPVAAKGFYEKIAEIGSEFPDNPTATMYGAFGSLFAGQTALADVAVENVMSTNPTDARILYLIACYYAHADNSDKALDYVSRALEAGYGNYYDWEYNTDARVNIEPLRPDLRYLNLLDRYKHLWSND